MRRPEQADAANRRITGPLGIQEARQDRATRMTATPSRILKWAGQGGIPGGTVGAHRRLFHGRPRTGRAGGVFPGLTRGAESGVHPCGPPAPWVVPGTRGGTGKADALMTRAVRESVTMAGRAERARVARVFTAGGPGLPCGDEAALLVSGPPVIEAEGVRGWG
jgi:hypothetical protein